MTTQPLRFASILGMASRSGLTAGLEHSFVIVGNIVTTKTRCENRGKYRPQYQCTQSPSRHAASTSTLPQCSHWRIHCIECILATGEVAASTGRPVQYANWDFFVSPLCARRATLRRRWRSSVLFTANMIGACTIPMVDIDL